MGFAHVRSGMLVDGGAYRDRTDDLMLAKQPLSQLSQGPLPNSARRQSQQSCALWRAVLRWPCLEECAAATLLRLSSCAMVGRVRVELTTSRLSGVRSNHLSYRPLRTQAGPKDR